MTAQQNQLVELLSEIKPLAKRYRQLTGRPIGIAGELAEFEAARLLGLELAVVRQEGYDALWYTPDGVKTVQIKGRVLLSNQRKENQAIGVFNTAKPWDLALLVLLNEGGDAIEIYQAPRAAVIAALAEPIRRGDRKGEASKGRERGQLMVGHFLKIASKVWPTEPLALPTGSKLSQFAGALSPETADRWQKEIEEMRNEWERDF